jgi:nicotinamidase-related amidase
MLSEFIIDFAQHGLTIAPRPHLAIDDTLPSQEKFMKALIVIDPQNAVFQLPIPLFKAEETLANIEKIIAAARQSGTAIIFLQHNRPNSLFERGKESWEFHQRIRPTNIDIIVQKSEPDGFMETELDAILKKMAVTEIFFCGFATEGCVDNTVRGAYTRGYKINLFEDAHSTTDNSILNAEVVLKYHNWLMQRFARLVKAADGI